MIDWEQGEVVETNHGKGGPLGSQQDGEGRTTETEGVKHPRPPRSESATSLPPTAIARLLPLCLASVDGNSAGLSAQDRLTNTAGPLSHHPRPHTLLPTGWACPELTQLKCWAPKYVRRKIDLSVYLSRSITTYTPAVKGKGQRQAVGFQPSSFTIQLCHYEKNHSASLCLNVFICEMDLPRRSNPIKIK